MLSVAVPQRDGSLNVSVVVSVDVAIPRPCHPGLGVPDSMLPPVPVGMEVDSAVASEAVVVVEVSVAAVAAASVVVVIDLAVLAGELDTRATAMASVDKLLPMPLRVPVVAVEDSEVVTAAAAVVPGSTVE